MDVRDLAPALLSLSTIIEETNRRVGSDREITTKFQAGTRGSLIVTLAVEASLIQELIGLFNSDAAQAIERVLAIVGGFAGVGVGLFKTIAYLNKAKPEAIAPGPTPQTIYVTVNNNTFITDKTTLEMATDPRMIKEASQVVKPLLRSGVESIYFESGTTNKSEGDYIAVQDLPAFAPENGVEISESEYRTVMTVESPNLGDVHGKWRLTDGEGHFWVRFSDSDFLNAVQAKEIRFGVNDALLCDVIRRQTRQPGGVYKTDYEVIKVVSFSSGQFLSNNSEPPEGPQLLLPL
jgi:hypothetical protein